MLQWLRGLTSLYILSAEAGYLLTGSIPAYAPCKYQRPSSEALQEIVALQRYVAAMADHDVEYEHAPFARAALDFVASEPAQHTLIVGTPSGGFSDWNSFLSPYQAHLHSESASCPLSWGGLLADAP